MDKLQSISDCIRVLYVHVHRGIWYDREIVFITEYEIYIMFFLLALAHQLDKNTVGYLTYKASGQSSMTTMIVRDTHQYRSQASIVLGIPHSYLSISYCHKLEKHDGRLRGAIK
jgi:hypothetical protein